MVQLDTPVVQREDLPDGRTRLMLASPQLAARVLPGQVLAIRPAASRFDPVLRVPVPLAGAAPTAGTISLLLTAQFGGSVRAGQNMDILGPIGRGWTVEATSRNLLLIGTNDQVCALLFLAESYARGRNVVLLVGAGEGTAALPAPLISPSVEYQYAQDVDAATAALDLLDDSLLRWADAMYVALPVAAYPSLAHRIRATRMRWERGFAQGLLIAAMACFSGICDTCLVPEARGPWRACMDGPQTDVRDFAR